MLLQGDKLGMEVTSEGTLSFLVNGKSQGVAAHNVYATNKLVYGFVDHYGQAVTSTISEGRLMAGLGLVHNSIKPG